MTKLGCDSDAKKTENQEKKEENEELMKDKWR